MDVVELLRPVYAGRRVLLACGPVQSKSALVAGLRSLGAADCLVVGSMGTGPVPDAEHLLVDVRPATLMDEFRRWERIAADPPAEVAAAVDRFAPDLVLTNGVESSTTFAGRPVFGSRPPAWTALEDKVTVDALWDAAGVPRAEAETAPLGGTAAWSAHRRLDAGAGTVWAGDARDGWHGGGELVRRVRSRAEAERVAADLGTRCDQVRVMPFLDGLPCSIHGFVTADAVAALRPVEIIVLRSSQGFRYCGVATTWDPAPGDREAMRAAARRVGSLLREEVGYRGCFTVDGVMTADGFRPTELNPRVGAGLKYVPVALPELPFGLLQAAAVGDGVSVDADELERAILPAADRSRVRGCHTLVPDRHVVAEETYQDGGCSLTLGPGTIGAMVRITTVDSPPDGEPFAPTAVKALALADRRWALGLGPLTAAPLVRG